MSLRMKEKDSKHKVHKETPRDSIKSMRGEQKI